MSSVILISIITQAYMNKITRISILIAKIAGGLLLILIAIPIGISEFGHLRALLSDRVVTYSYHCMKHGDQWKAEGVFGAVGAERLSYRVSFPNQFVIGEDFVPPWRPKECSIGSAENWTCTDKSLYPWLRYHDGEMQTHCEPAKPGVWADGGECYFEMTPAQHFVTQILHPLDSNLKNQADEVCKSSSGYFDLLMSNKAMPQ